MDLSVEAKPLVNDSPANQDEKLIEASRRRAREDYHLPDTVYLLPFDTHCFDPYIASRMQELYADRDQNQRHHTVFFFAKFQLMRLECDEYGLPLDNEACELDEIYGRLLKLCDNRAEYIRATGRRRISLWSQWQDECMKPASARNEGFVAACASTITFQEEDFEKRKLDFVTEVYALLDKHDPENAKMVLKDLQVIWPSATINHIKCLEKYTVDYSHIPQAKQFVTRESNWTKIRYA